MLSTEHLCELPLAYKPCTFRVKWADAAWEIQQARRLRREVFCAEQGVFEDDDADSIDSQSQTLVAVSQLGAMPDQVVGTVRIHQSEPGVWWGSRLAVHPSFRHVGRIGATLIRLAVCSARAQGAHTFCAHVQQANVPLFERLNWHSLAGVSLHGRPHAWMQADLTQHPPCHAPDWGFLTQSAPRANAVTQEPA